MAFGVPKNSVSLEDIMNRVTEIDILSFYFNIKEIPCVIHSPFREDNRPSFGLYLSNNGRIYYKDYATNENGGIFDLLGKLWKCDYKKVLERIDKDILKINKGNIKINNTANSIIVRNNKEHNSNSDLQCKVRDWRNYDIEYWNQYGISLEWLKYAEVYPISHKIVIKNQHKYIFKADKLAYAYVEHKEGKVSIKVYQPLNTNGYKWSSKHDSSVVSLWTKVPEYGDILCICSSLKDSLCLWANMGIPSISPQGEGYNMSNTAINELKRRYKRIFVLFDNDEAGKIDGLKFSTNTGFINIVLPDYGAKDVSDLYKLVGKDKWLQIIIPLFKEAIKEKDSIKDNNNNIIN